MKFIDALKYDPFMSKIIKDQQIEKIPSLEQPFDRVFEFSKPYEFVDILFISGKISFYQTDNFPLFIISLTTIMNIPAILASRIISYSDRYVSDLCAPK